MGEYTFAVNGYEDHPDHTESRPTLAEAANVAYSVMWRGMGSVEEIYHDGELVWSYDNDSGLSELVKLTNEAATVDCTCLSFCPDPCDGMCGCNVHMPVPDAPNSNIIFVKYPPLGLEGGGEDLSAAVWCLAWLISQKAAECLLGELEMHSVADGSSFPDALKAIQLAAGGIGCDTIEAWLLEDDGRFEIVEATDAGVVASVT